MGFIASLENACTAENRKNCLLAVSVLAGVALALLLAMRVEGKLSTHQWGCGAIATEIITSLYPLKMIADFMRKPDTTDDL